jgi:hypothetical protein
MAWTLDVCKIPSVGVDMARSLFYFKRLLFLCLWFGLASERI